MSGLDLLPALEQQILGRLPERRSPPHRIAEFTESFGASVIEAADMTALMVGTLSPTALAELAAKVADILVAAIAIAAAQMEVSGSLWIFEAQHWAVKAYFARIAEVQGDMVKGGGA